MVESILVTLDKLTYGGDAMGRLPDARAVFVPFALPGEQVRIHLVEEKRGYARAELLEIIQPASERITARCPHFGICGGCHYQHLPYASQLEIKTGILSDQLTRIGGITNPPIQPIQPCPNPWNYRNHVQFHVHTDGSLGFLAPNSNHIVPIRECHLPEELLNDVWPQVEFETGSGIERLGLRLGSDEEIMLLLESRQPEIPGVDVQAGISVVHQYDGESLVLVGEDHLHMEIHSDRASQSCSFHVSAGSFFQVNTRMAGVLVDHLLTNLPGNLDTLLDVYCGVGLFSAFLAPHVRRLIGIEASSAACEDFSLNLDEFDNVELYEASAEQVLPALQIKPDFILLDPPRAGLERTVLEAILAMQPKALAYVSCDPATLARDARRLLEGGYVLQKVTPFDLFPHTYHIESISFFSC
ncbi:MAG: class I SAM-dependent RNA methyltransferase [bacterium]